VGDSEEESSNACSDYAIQNISERNTRSCWSRIVTHECIVFRDTEKLEKRTAIARCIKRYNSRSSNGTINSAFWSLGIEGTAWRVCNYKSIRKNMIQALTADGSIIK
jgi:hypothetical protein